MPKRINHLPGEKRGQLTLVREVEARRRSSVARADRYGEFRCDCGAGKVVRMALWRSGRTRSCGCLVRTHGMASTRIYKCWAGMKHRSTVDGVWQRQNPSYRGVGRDPRWDEFDAFYADMGDSWFSGAVLARHGDKGDYEPGNCRWITKSENASEVSHKPKHLTADGRPAVQVAIKNGVSRAAFYERVRRGWSPDEACLPYQSQARRVSVYD